MTRSEARLPRWPERNGDETVGGQQARGLGGQGAVGFFCRGPRIIEGHVPDRSRDQVPVFASRERPRKLPDCSSSREEGGTASRLWHSRKEVGTTVCV